MISNEERREVAARLRMLASHKAADEELVHDTLGLYRGENIEGYDTYGVMHLADLIEPEPERTCRNTTRHPHYGFECSECKWSAYEPNDYGNDVCFDDFNYCPNCGAKVVEVV